MTFLAILLPLLLLSFTASAQQPAPCALEMPATLSANSEARAQAKCPCRVAVFEAKVFNRWAQEVWKTSKLEGFPNDLLSAKDVAAGTYFWQVKYTAIVNGTPAALETKGYINVMK